MIPTYGSGVVSIRFLAKKSRVAPLLTTSIPRLELMAAVLELRMTDSISRVLNVTTDQATLWSDSANVLGWIRGRSHSFKPFVANRVGENQKNRPTKVATRSNQQLPTGLTYEGI